MSQINVTQNLARFQDPKAKWKENANAEVDNMFGFTASGRRLAYSFAPHYRELI